MGFGKFSSNESSVTEIPHFQLKGGEDVLKDNRSHNEYAEYQRKYKEATGVFPELDKKNFPVCAVPSQKVLLPIDLKKSVKKNTAKGIGQLVGGAVKLGLGAAGAGDIASFIPDKDDNIASAMSCIQGKQLIPTFELELEIAIHKFKYAYSLMSVLNFSAIDELPAMEYFSDHSLGFKKCEDGSYYEGTWENGELIYGLTYIPDSGAFIGTYDDKRAPDEGVMFDGTNFQIGLFKDGELDCLHGAIITVDVSDEEDHYAYLVEVGGYEKGRRNGDIIRYAQTVTGQLYISEGKFDFDEPVKRSWREKRKRNLETTPLVSRLYLLYLAIAFEAVAFISLFGGLGATGSEAFMYFAIFAVIGGICAFSFFKIQKAVSAKKKQLAELKKQGQSYISK